MFAKSVSEGSRRFVGQALKLGFAGWNLLLPDLAKTTKPAFEVIILLCWPSILSRVVDKALLSAFACPLPHLASTEGNAGLKQRA